jgi:hypothetical protein
VSKHKGRQPGAKAKRCTDGYGVKSVRIMAKAKERGLHLNAGGQIVLPSGKVHQGTPQWGRDRINLSIDGERVLISTARVVCFLAHGNPPHPTSVADHIDGNTLNDHPDNLRWATYSENTRNTSFARSETWEMKAIRACTGMADPQAEIAVLREAVRVLGAAVRRDARIAAYNLGVEGENFEKEIGEWVAPSVMSNPIAAAAVKGTQ